MSILDLLPHDRVFTWREVRGCIPTAVFKGLVDDGYVLRLFKGLYVVSGVPLTVERRAQALASVLPRGAVATDETAAWLAGVDVFYGLDEDGYPRLSFFQTGPHERLRNKAVLSGSRQLARRDVYVVHGVTATTPLRTLVDLARLRRPERAIGAIDGLMRAGDLTREEVIVELERFKGYRGIVMARELVPLGDPRSESPAEARLRLAWVTAGLRPHPEPQLRVDNPWGWEPWRLDLGVEELKYAAEYDGYDFHSTPEQRENDRRRRGYMSDVRGWTFDVFEKKDVYPRGSNPAATIAAGLARARRNLSLPERDFRWPA